MVRAAPAENQTLRILCVVWTPVIELQSSYARAAGTIGRVAGGPENDVVPQNDAFVQRDRYGKIRTDLEEARTALQQPSERDAKIGCHRVFVEGGKIAHGYYGSCGGLGGLPSSSGGGEAGGDLLNEGGGFLLDQWRWLLIER